MMRRWLRRAARRAVPVLAAAALLAAGPSPAHAQSGPEILAAGVPPEIIQVETVGQWRDDNASGEYRVILLVAGKDREYGARVYVQWLGTNAEGRRTVFKVAPISEINTLKLASAWFAVVGDNDDEITIVVSTYDSKLEKEVQQAFKATTPGEYTKVAVPKQAEPTPPPSGATDPASPAAVPSAPAAAEPAPTGPVARNTGEERGGAVAKAEGTSADAPAAAARASAGDTSGSVEPSAAGAALVPAGSASEPAGSGTVTAATQPTGAIAATAPTPPAVASSTASPAKAAAGSRAQAGPSRKKASGRRQIARAAR